MKSQTRALIVILVVFILFSTPLMGPFSYFSDLVARLAAAGIALLPISSAWSAVAQVLFRALALTALLLFGRSRQSHYVAAICALVEMVHHLVIAVTTKSLYPVSLAIAIGLALALLFLLLPSHRPSLWLSDAFILAIPVGLLYDVALKPVFSLFRLPARVFSPLFILPDQSLADRLAGHLGLPALAWSLLAAILALIPIALWARGRQKG